MSDTHSFGDNFGKSIPIDWTARLESGFQDKVADLASRVIAFHHLETIRPVKASTLDQITRTINCLLANLLRAALASRECFLAVPQDSSVFKKTRYFDQGIGYDNTKRVVEFLKAHSPNLVTYKRGMNDRRPGGRSFVTRMRALPALLEHLSFQTSTNEDVNTLGEGSPNIPLPITHRKPLSHSSVVHAPSETIRLKDAEKELVSYQDDENTEGMRATLKQWNDFTNRHCIDLYLTDVQLQRIYDRSSNEAEQEDEPFREEEERPSFIDLTRTNLYRVFNNGSWDQGGRFYGAWWQRVPSEYRKFITINSSFTAEIDYSNLHPAMLYAKEGIRLEDYAYALPGIDARYKKLIKATFFKLINAEEGQPIRPPRPESLPPSLTWTQLQDAVKERHSRIAQYFNTGIGLKLQKIDSTIAEEVMFRMSLQRRLLLPIHDSFITYRGAHEALKQEMLETYQSHMDSEIAVTIDASFVNAMAENDLPSNDDYSLGQDQLEAVDHNAQGYEGYHERYADFLARQTPERRAYLEGRHTQ